jgi:DNA mismatch repair protein MutS2
VLGFPTVLERLAGLCVSAVGRERALALAPSPWIEEVTRRQQETGGLPVRGARDIRAPTHRAEIGGVLTPRELLDVRDTLAVTRVLKGFIASREDQVPVLADIADGIEILSDLEAEIAAALNDEGLVPEGRLAAPDQHHRPGRARHRARPDPPGAARRRGAPA